MQVVYVFNYNGRLVELVKNKSSFQSTCTNCIFDNTECKERSSMHCIKIISKFVPDLDNIENLSEISYFRWRNCSLYYNIYTKYNNYDKIH